VTFVDGTIVAPANAPTATSANAATRR
jgi:hypothetical protein